MLTPKSKNHMGLLTADDKKQAAYQGLLQAGLGLMAAGAPSMSPQSYSQGLASAGAGFTQGYQGHLNQMRDNRLTNIQAETAKAQAEKARIDVDNMGRQQKAWDAMFTPPQSPDNAPQPTWGNPGDQMADASSASMPGGQQPAMSDVSPDEIAFARALGPQAGMQYLSGIRQRRAEQAAAKELERYKADLRQNDPSRRYVSVPQLGVYDTATGGMISPYGNVGGMGGMPQQPQQPPSSGMQDNQGSPALPQQKMPPGLSPKGAETWRLEAAKSGRSALEKSAEQRDQARDMVRSLDRFEKLLGQQDTGGPLRQLPGAQWFEGSVMGDAEIAEMGSIVDKMTPLMRQGMPGAASDRDVAMFRGATVGVDKPVETNRNIIAGMKTANENTIDRHDFRTWYFGEQGSLDGADGVWERYLAENPIFDPARPDAEYAINKDRLSWREWLSGGQRSQRQTQPSGGQGGAQGGWSIRPKGQ